MWQIHLFISNQTLCKHFRQSSHALWWCEVHFCHCTMYWYIYGTDSPFNMSIISMGAKLTRKYFYNINTLGHYVFFLCFRLWPIYEKKLSISSDKKTFRKKTSSFQEIKNILAAMFFFACFFRRPH